LKFNALQLGIINNNTAFMFQQTAVISFLSTFYIKCCVFSLLTQKDELKLYGFHTVYIAASLFRAVPWWPWALHVNLTTANVEHEAEESSQLLTIQMIMAHHNDRFHLVWQSVIIFSEVKR
jgi:hypothetical protein